MPSKNIVKVYSEDRYYHLYNRGVEKRPIFLDEQDYSVFLSYLKQYLLPKNEEELRAKLSNPLISYKEKGQILKLLRMNNFHGEIFMLCYCLMPNHFHLLVKQRNSGSIDKFMNSICTRYTMYFNKKYKRIGRLYQDVYKAVLVENEMQLLYLTAYIHRNPTIGKRLRTKGDPFRAWFSQPSSYPEYLGQKQTKWVSTDEILSFFSKNNPQLSYQNFVEQTNDITPIADLFLDS